MECIERKSVCLKQRLPAVAEVKTFGSEMEGDGVVSRKFRVSCFTALFCLSRAPHRLAAWRLHGHSDLVHAHQTEFMRAHTMPNQTRSSLNPAMSIKINPDYNKIFPLRRTLTRLTSKVYIRGGRANLLCTCMRVFEKTKLWIYEEGQSL